MAENLYHELPVAFEIGNVERPRRSGWISFLAEDSDAVLIVGLFIFGDQHTRIAPFLFGGALVIFRALFLFCVSVSVMRAGDTGSGKLGQTVCARRLRIRAGYA